MTDPTYEQVAFRFRNDDGSEAAATWTAIINTDISQNPNNGWNQRLRFDILNDNNRNESNLSLEYEYSYNTGAWTSITGASSVIRGYDSSFLTDAEDCTQIISAGGFSADNDGVTEDGTVIVPSFSRNDRIETELSYYLVEADVAPGDTIDVRVISTAGYSITYTNTPQITVTAQRRIVIGHA